MKLYISEDVTYNNSSIDAYDGQVDMILKMYDEIEGKKQKVGYITYIIFRNEIHIQMIKSFFKKRGYAEKMLKWLINEYPEYDIYPGMTTDEGTLFFAKMYQKGILKKKEIANKHLDFNELYKKIRLKSVRAAKFLKILVNNGNNSAFKFLKKDRDLNGFDPNELYDISQWIKGSVTNDNFPEDEPPYWITEYLKEMGVL